MGVRTNQRGWQSYAGQSKRLIIGIDIGTTFSGASYCILRPGEKPKIVDVGNFPNQSGGGQYKTSSNVIYSADGTILAIGGETDKPDVRNVASVTGASEARWWKMGLGNQASCNHTIDRETLKQKVILPPNKSAEDVYTDYLAWIVGHVERFIAAHHQNGQQFVTETRLNRLLVLTHPNGWEGAQQTAMRRACVKARVIADANRAATMIKFVSEAEASLTYSLMCQTMASWTQPGSHVAIVDAGGGTIDISAYKIDSVDPFITVREVSISQCMFEGSTGVDCRARAFIGQRLHGTRWDNEEDLEAIVLDFVRTIKHSFASARTPCILKIGSAVDTDESIGLRKGLLVFEGQEIAELFQGAVHATIHGLESIFASYPPSVPKRVAFVGGFSENTYLRESVAKALGHHVTLAKPDNSTAKAVANGAVAWAIDGVVTARVAKMSYGVRCSIPLDRKNKVHAARLHTKIHSADGQARLPNAFHVLHAKGDVVTDEMEIKAPFSMTKDSSEEFQGSFDLLVWRGDDDPPQFINDDEQQGFETLCTLEVNLDRLKHGLPVHSSNGKRFRSVCFEIHITLCETELSARWVWNGQSLAHSGDAETIYLDDLEFFTRKAAAPAQVGGLTGENVQEDPEARGTATPLSTQRRLPTQENDDVSSIASISGSAALIDQLTDEQVELLYKRLELKKAKKNKPLPATVTDEDDEEELLASQPSEQRQVLSDVQNIPTYRPTVARNASVRSSSSSSSTMSSNFTPPPQPSARRRAPPPVPLRTGRNASPAPPTLTGSGSTNLPSQQRRAGAKGVEAASELEQLGFTGALQAPPPPYNAMMEESGGEAEAEAER